MASKKEYTFRHPARFKKAAVMEGTLAVTGATTFAGALTAGSVTTAGDVSGDNGVFTGDISGVNGTLTGDLGVVGVTASGDISGVNGTLTGDLGVVNVNATGDLAGVNGTLTGDLDAVNVNATGDLALSGKQILNHVRHYEDFETFADATSIAEHYTITGAGATLGATAPAALDLASDGAGTATSLRTTSYVIDGSERPYLKYKFSVDDLSDAEILIGFTNAAANRYFQLWFSKTAVHTNWFIRAQDATSGAVSDDTGVVAATATDIIVELWMDATGLHANINSAPITLTNCGALTSTDLTLQAVLCEADDNSVAAATITLHKFIEDRVDTW